MNENSENRPLNKDCCQNEEKKVTIEPQAEFENISETLDTENSVAEEFSFVDDAAPITPSVNTPLPSQPVQENRSFSYEWNSPNPDTMQKQHSFPANTDAPKKKTKKSEGAKTPVALLLVLTILLSSFFGAGSAFVMYKLLDKSYGGNGKNSEDTQYNSSSPAETLGKDELTTAEITEHCASTVVEIFTESVDTGIFSQQYIKSGAGSGVIIESDGYIVTNHHVIDGANKVSVTLRTGEIYEAQIIRTDQRMELAILKIEPDKALSVAAFGDSDALVIGERTVAIGNPLGQLGGTVTEGILSALDREMVIDGQKMNLLQTDTAINPGNSGGGLFNAKGQLIGIVSAKSTGSEIEGLGFAIPINDVLDVVSDLKEYGYVKGRVDLGMELIDIDSIELMFIYGTYDYGCLVYRVYEDTNAYKAGFRAYDIILAVNSEEVNSSDDVELIINDLKIGDKVTFTVQRGRTQAEITMELEEYAQKNFQNSDDEGTVVLNPELF